MPVGTSSTVMVSPARAGSNHRIDGFSTRVAPLSATIVPGRAADQLALDAGGDAVAAGDRRGASGALVGGLGRDRDQGLAGVDELALDAEHGADLEGAGLEAAALPPGERGGHAAGVAGAEAVDHGPLLDPGGRGAGGVDGPAGAGRGGDGGPAGAVGAHDQAAGRRQPDLALAAHDLDRDQRQAVVGEREPARVQHAQLVAGRGLVGARGGGEGGEGGEGGGDGRSGEPGAGHARG